MKIVFKFSEKSLLSPYLPSIHLLLCLGKKKKEKVIILEAKLLDLIGNGRFILTVGFRVSISYLRP